MDEEYGLCVRVSPMESTSYADFGRSRERERAAERPADWEGHRLDE